MRFARLCGQNKQAVSVMGRVAMPLSRWSEEATMNHATRADMKQYGGPNGEHSAFDAEFEALCDRYGVQGVAFYGGFGRVVARGRFSDRQMMVFLLRQTIKLATEMVGNSLTVLSKGPGFQVWLTSEDRPGGREREQ